MESILYQTKSLNQYVVRYAFNKSKIDKVPTPTQMFIIRYLKNNEKVYQKDLEKALNIRRATISEVLKTMEKNNLIERITDKEDTRVKQIILLDKGNDIYKLVNKTLKETEKALIKDISKEDIETFLKVVKKMKENVKC